jgi:hypothetical protein
MLKSQRYPVKERLQSHTSGILEVVGTLVTITSTTECVCGATNPTTQHPHYGDPDMRKVKYGEPPSASPGL